MLVEFFLKFDDSSEKKLNADFLDVDAGKLIGICRNKLHQPLSLLFPIDNSPDVNGVGNDT